MGDAWTEKRMLELGQRHAALEARCDLEGVMGTLVEEPVYEFYPARLGMRGRSEVRRYYEHLFSKFISRTRSYELIAEWANESAVAQEYEIELEVDGKLERHRVLGILFASGELLGGERVYASERCIRLMVGDGFERLDAL